jgi:uncharacterized protein YbjT (DUF2867 family)
MFVVLGASGHTGAVVAKNLIAGGQKVRVVGRSAEHLQSLARGAEAFTADAATLRLSRTRARALKQPTF